jgi:hypothetical protein
VIVSITRFLFAALLIGIQLAGCGLHPVRPYERGHLNSSAMRANRETAITRQREQSLTLQEAMRQGRSDDVAPHR